MNRRRVATVLVVLTGGVLLFAFFAPVVYFHADKTSCNEGVCTETLGNGYDSIWLSLTGQMHANRYGGFYANSGGSPWSYGIFWDGQLYKITS